MSNKYYKLSRKERKLTHPPETRFIKLTSLAPTTFLSLSILTPPQPSSATDLLAALQSTSSTVSLTTSTSPINLSLQAANADATSSICPKGWRLPSRTGNPSYTDLLTSAGLISSTSGDASDATAALIDTIRHTPYSFTLAGYTHGLAVEAFSVHNSYWTRTAVDINQAYRFGIARDGTYYTENPITKLLGYSVRCVLTP